MSPLRLRHLNSYGLLALALVVFTASILFSFNRIKESHQAALETSGVSLWLAFQADYELQRLLNALDLYALGDGDVDRQTLLDRFDIFWSRLPLLVEGPDSSAIKRISDAEVVVPGLIAELEAIEPLILALEPQDRRAYRPLRQRLAGFREPLRRIAQEVDRTLGEEQTVLRHRMGALYADHTVYLVGILGSAAVLIFLLIREALASRRLLVAASAARARAEHLAYHDPLTDLPNRALFHDRLLQALAHARRHGRTVAVHYLDLDRFKEVNDVLGHAAGDSLLIAAAHRMRACLRDADTLARLGGDEFAVVQTDLADSHGAATLAQRLTAAFRQPLVIEGQEVPVSVSAGITLFPEDGEDLAQLLKNADVALYQAKADGRNAYRFFGSEMSRPGQAWRTFEPDRRRAL